MTTPHIGDTSEFPTVRWGIPGGTEPDPPKRRWSRTRKTTAITAAASVTLYVLAVAGHLGQRVVDLPEAGIAILRAAMVLACAAHLAVWAWDGVAPKLFARFAATRIADRAIEARLTQIDKALTGVVLALRGVDHKLSRSHERATAIEATLGKVSAAVKALGEQVASNGAAVAKLPTATKAYGADRHRQGVREGRQEGRQDGYEQAMRDIADAGGVPTQRVSSNGSSNGRTTGGHLKPV